MRHRIVSTSTLSHVILLLYMASCIEGDCPRPAVYQDKTHRNYDASYSTGDQATYECSPGYVFKSGQKISTCQSDGTWSQVTLQCERVSCSSPGTPNKGTRSGNDFRVGEQVTFSCNEGYRLIGDDISTCMTDLTWSNSVPRCNAITCPTPQAPQYGSINPPGEANYNDIVTIECDRGKTYSEESNTRRCTGDGWTGTQGTCTEANCGLPILYNGKVDAPSGTGYAVEIRYSCNDGTTMDKSQALEDSGGYSRCYDTGKWVPSPPTCNLDCGEVPVVTHGSISNSGRTSYPHNTELDCNCNHGFMHTGVYHVTCNNGTWTPNVDITCVEVPTPKPTKAPAPDTTDRPKVTPPPTNKKTTLPSSTVQDRTESPENDGSLPTWAIICIVIVIIVPIWIVVICCCRRKQQKLGYKQEERYHKDVLDKVKKSQMPEKIKDLYSALADLIKDAVLVDKQQNEDIVNGFLNKRDTLLQKVKELTVRGEETGMEALYVQVFKLTMYDLKWVKEENTSLYIDSRETRWENEIAEINGNYKDDKRFDEFLKSMKGIHDALITYVGDYHPTGLTYIHWTRRCLLLGMCAIEKKHYTVPDQPTSPKKLDTYVKVNGTESERALLQGASAEATTSM